MNKKNSIFKLACVDVYLLFTYLTKSDIGSTVVDAIILWHLWQKEKKAPVEKQSDVCCVVPVLCDCCRVDWGSSLVM